MKKECAYTRKSLRKYLFGHLFMLQKNRIKRHLKSCVVCSSEYQALKRENETRQMLRDITPPEGLVQQLKEVISALAKVKKLFYRPLWMAAIVGVVVVVFLNVAQQPRDVEIENLEKSLPPVPAASSSVASVPTATPSTVPAQPSAVQAVAAPVPAPAPVPEAPAAEPLVITITPADDQVSVQRINAVMRGHGSLRKLRFSDTARELSGRLTAKELLTFFDRIDTAGKVSYSRKRFETFPAALPIPFVMKLKNAPIAVQPPTQTAPKTDKPATTAQPISAPTQTPHP